MIDARHHEEVIPGDHFDREPEVAEIFFGTFDETDVVFRFARDSPLEGAVSSEPVSGVRFPGYWEKIQGISAESQQERF